jgi:hypothetical protein
MMIVVFACKVLSVLRFWLEFCLGFFLGLIKFYVIWTFLCYTAYKLGALAA